MFTRIRVTIQSYIESLQQYFLYYFYRCFVFDAVTNKQDEKPRLLFGPCPIINNKYWALALRSKGYKAHSITCAVPLINTRADFDLLIDELIPIKGKRNVWNLTKQKLMLFNYILKEYDVFVMAFRFNYFENTVFSKKEAGLLHKFGKKIVIIPYGSDFYMYSKVIDPSLRHNLMINVPDEIFKEKRIEKKVEYWVQYADSIIMATMIDGACRWDALPVNTLCIDLDKWSVTTKKQTSDGINSPVTIVHTPNHRGFKGTEFIVKAIKELKEEGLKIDFILIEKMLNEEVRTILTTQADILVEQIVYSGYALSGIEGMAAGLTVFSNLENDNILNLFRRYSYLNECPIVSTSPETIKENLRMLITQPELRQKIGIASREYAEKYHSYHMFASLFGEIEKKIWKNDTSADAMNFFNPQNASSYNNTIPIIEHPLKRNQVV